LRVLGAVSWVAGDFEAGGSLMEESLAAFDELGDERGVAIVSHRLGIAALNAGDLARGRALLEASLETCHRLPDPKLEGDVLRGLAVVEKLEGNPARALELYEESIELLERIGHTWILASSLRSSAELLHELGETPRAEDRAREALRLSHDLVDRQATVYSLALLASLAVTAGNLGRAGRLWGALESEVARGPVGYWEADQDEYEARVVRRDADFERGYEAGQRLSLDEAVATALSVDSPS
jgi:tetratricopeptide (TPR) repeat protein